jgi:hypothetical protein
MTDNSGLELAVAEAYWRILGRAPDRAGLEHHVEALRQGLSIEELTASLRESPERLDQEVGVQVFKAAESHAIPYRLDRRASATHLVVGFPGVSLGATPPISDAPQLADFPVHCLALGMGEDRPYAAEDLDHWVSVASELVTEVAADLSVPPDRVICIGQSYQGAVATRVALRSGMGCVLAGAPTILWGRWMRRLMSSESLSPEARALLHTYIVNSGFTDNGDVADRFDRVMFEELERANGPCDLRLLASPTDNFYAEVSLFADRAATRPNIRALLVEGRYRGHDNLRGAYWRFVLDSLGKIAGKTG